MTNEESGHLDREDIDIDAVTGVLSRKIDPDINVPSEDTKDYYDLYVSSPEVDVWSDENE